MTDYAKLDVSLLYSSHSDYSSPTFTSTIAAAALTPAQLYSAGPISVPTAGTAPTISGFTTINSLIVHNRDETNYVTIAYTSASASAAVGLRLAAGGTAVLPDVKVSSSLTLTAHTAACLCDVIIVGT